ncbi:hypothetical protein PAESOLCIP111_03736 [Paenibacillus solanacearum]|uniref:LTD domain-containing protein n=1 Tax=Paenibacillus solanacearum TaxID=2048548 RepID=A0A916K6K9_9BACL|nr:lamin tail domain-containing protein [Paenibacillus solanacearum]CAG7636285.1 hypothetical protein PAESOLCIP111_03736 [Paenibacillus solanacearum]
MLTAKQRQKVTCALVLSFLSTGAAIAAEPVKAAETNAIPSVMITELIPNAKNVKPTGAKDNFDEAYEMIELYNNSDQALKLSDIRIVVKDGFDEKDKENAPWNWGEDAGRTIPPHGVMIVWIKQANNPFTLDDFYKFYRSKNPDLEPGQVAVASGIGLYNTGKRMLFVTKADGTKISAIAYEGSTADPTVDDRAIHYSYPTDGSIQLRKFQSGKDSLSTPGKLSAEQIPPAPVKAEPKPAFSAVEIATKLGMLTGEGSGVTAEYLAKTPTRIQSAVMFLRLKGLETEAAGFKGDNPFSDASSAEWAAPILAYIKAHPELGMEGVGDNQFDPNAAITAQAYYKIMLQSLGYQYGTDFTWEQTIAFAGSKGLGKAAEASKFTLSELATATVETLRATVKGSNKTLAQVLVEQKAMNADLAKSVGLN